MLVRKKTSMNPSRSIVWLVKDEGLKREKEYQRRLHKNEQNISAGGLSRAAPKGIVYVRALNDRESDDFNFHDGDIIQLIKKSETGLWEGFLNGVGWWL